MSVFYDIVDLSEARQLLRKSHKLESTDQWMVTESGVFHIIFNFVKNNEFAYVIVLEMFF